MYEIKTSWETKSPEAVVREVSNKGFAWLEVAAVNTTRRFRVGIRGPRDLLSAAEFRGCTGVLCRLCGRLGCQYWDFNS